MSDGPAGKSEALATGLHCLAEVELAGRLPGPKSARSAKHLARLAPLARHTKRAWLSLPSPLRA
eukprot:4454467-Alexandrium_andersonii.AAC.1